MTPPPGASPNTAFVQFRGVQGSQAGLRRDSEAINGQLMAFLCGVSRAGKAVFGNGPVSYE